MWQSWTYQKWMSKPKKKKPREEIHSVHILWHHVFPSKMTKRHCVPKTDHCIAPLCSNTLGASLRSFGIGRPIQTIAKLSSLERIFFFKAPEDRTRVRRKKICTQRLFEKTPMWTTLISLKQYCTKKIKDDGFFFPAENFPWKCSLDPTLPIIDYGYEATPAFSQLKPIKVMTTRRNAIQTFEVNMMKLLSLDINIFLHFQI